MCASVAESGVYEERDTMVVIGMIGTETGCVYRKEILMGEVKKKEGREEEKDKRRYQTGSLALFIFDTPLPPPPHPGRNVAKYPKEKNGLVAFGGSFFALLIQKREKEKKGCLDGTDGQNREGDRSEGARLKGGGSKTKEDEDKGRQA